MPPLIEFREPVQQYNQQEQQLQEYIQVYELQPEPSHQQQQQQQQQQPHPVANRYQQVPAHSWGTEGWTATYVAVPKGLPTRPLSPPFRPVISSVQSLVKFKQ